MNDKCLYCYGFLEDETDFHEKCAKKIFGANTAPILPYNNDQMAELAKNVIEHSISVPGVQPKLSVSVVKKTQKITSRFTVVGALGGNYILKPPSDRFPEMPSNEHLTMRIAEAFKIQVVPSSLIRLASGELAYVCKRIDRTENGKKIHMIDMFQITEAYDKYKSSVEKIGKALQSYSSNPLLDKILLFELVLFSFLTGNNDMHLKNFSMIKTFSGWVLAPAYDLLNVSIVLPEDKEELALPLEGKKKKLKKEHFIKFGLDMGMSQKQINSIFTRMIKNKPFAFEWLNKSFLSDKMREAYSELIDKRYLQLNLE